MPACSTKYISVAQLAERWSPKPKVVRSIRTWDARTVPPHLLLRSLAVSGAKSAQ